MNILHLSPYYPDLEANHAGGVCMGKQIETLRQWNKVYVLTFEASAFDHQLKEKRISDKYYQSVKINWLGRVFHILLTPWMPNFFAVRSSLRFSLKLIQSIKKYKIDVIHAEYAAMGQYLWIKRLFPGLRFNLIEHDVTVQLYERKAEKAHGLKKLYLQVQRDLIFRTERTYCNRADRVFVMNEKDKQLIEERYGRKECLVLNPFYGIDENVLSKPEREEDREDGMICFLGQMGRDENFLAAMRLVKIADNVKKKYPQLQVYIVGNQPPEQLKQLESEYVHVTGFVEDVDVYLKRAQLAVFPLTLGAGIKLKVLRSLAMGTPVITGEVGAEGIDEDGEVLILAETDQEYEEKILLYLNQKEMLKQSGERSRAFAEQKFSWKRSEQILGEVYR